MGVHSTSIRMMIKKKLLASAKAAKYTCAIKVSKRTTPNVKKKEKLPF
jgi:hypothetical protein